MVFHEKVGLVRRAIATLAVFAMIGSETAFALTWNENLFIQGGNALNFQQGVLSGSYTRFSESWGINYIGDATHPFRFSSSSLVVGNNIFAPNGSDFGSNNLLVAGNVGIGTTNPQANLDILKQGHLPGIHVKSSNSDEGGALWLGNNTYEWLMYCGGAGFYVNEVNGGNFNRLLIQHNTGNVGIGTMFPGSRLQVDGGVAIGYSASQNAPTNGLLVSGNVGIGTTNAINGKMEVQSIGVTSIYGNTSSGPYGIWGNCTGVAGGGGYGVYGTSDGAGVVGKSTGDAVQGTGTGVFGMGPPTPNGVGVMGSVYNGIAIFGGTSGDGYGGYFQNKVCITGKLGIGRDPGPGTEILEVAGNAKCDTVKCMAVKINNWTLKAPDYVFEKGYKLPSLKEVEKKIAADKHLPGVPSAAEMKKKGIDLVNMNMALLKKVEELTLYAIEQNKKIAAQEHRIIALENRGK